MIYNGYAEASKVTPDWHGWLHYTFDDLPTAETLPRQVWEKEHRPNLTGTVNAWRPTGSIARSGEASSTCRRSSQTLRFSLTAWLRRRKAG